MSHSAHRRPAKHDACPGIRACDTCARARQATAADYAEILETLAPNLVLTVAHPIGNHEASSRALRAALTAAAPKSGGIWSIETGEQHGQLHVNLISAPLERTPRGALRVWSEPICTTARAVAAYITKRAGMPAEHAYRGRTFGTFGNLWHYLADSKSPWLVRAAALEHAIRPHLGDLIARQPGAQPDKPPAPRSAPLADYMADALRHLPATAALMHARGQIDSKKR